MCCLWAAVGAEWECLCVLWSHGMTKAELLKKIERLSPYDKLILAVQLVCTPGKEDVGWELASSAVMEWRAVQVLGKVRT